VTASDVYALLFAVGFFLALVWLTRATDEQ
jgi:hypothetical protein